MRFLLAVVVCMGCVGNIFADGLKPRIEFRVPDNIAEPIRAAILNDPFNKLRFEKDYKTRIEAAKSLAKVEKLSTDDLKKLIEVIREELLKLARPLGPDDRLASEQLTRACIDVLVKTGKKDDSVFAFFKKLATNPDIKHPNSIFALQTLVEWAEDNNDKLKEVYPIVVAGIRNNAHAPDYIALLPAFGDRARSATSTLRPLTTSENPLVRASAEKALGFLDRK